jgi:hypothetical protein
MLEIAGARLQGLPIIGLELVRHLDYFDGPLLSHFRHRRQGDNYLYYWCECDETANRWMVLRVSETNIIRLVNRFVPLDFVVPKACQDDYVYFVDVDANGSTEAVLLAHLSSIPSDYVPAHGAYLEAAAQDFGSFAVLIERNLSIKNLSEFPHAFELVYAFVYSLLVLRPQKLEAHPWRGGFSNMHFCRWLLDRIPSEHYPSVSTMQYASPGFIRFSSLDSRVAKHVGILLARFEESGKDIKESYRNLMAYIRQNKLNDIVHTGDSRWDAHESELTSLTLELLNALKIPDPGELMQAAERSFEAAKVVLSFTRRLRKLAEWGEDGLVKYPVPYTSHDGSERE